MCLDIFHNIDNNWQYSPQQNNLFETIVTERPNIIVKLFKKLSEVRCGTQVVDYVLYWVHYSILKIRRAEDYQALVGLGAMEAMLAVLDSNFNTPQAH